MANDILAHMNDYGESREGLETHWVSWMHHLPFDSRVGSALDRLYQARLAKLDPEREQALYHRLAKKRALLQERTNRYHKKVFVGGVDDGTNEDSTLGPQAQPQPKSATQQGGPDSGATETNG